MPRNEHGLLVFENSTQYYYLFDGLGSVVGLTDHAGNLVSSCSYSYDPYGNQTGTTSGCPTNPYTYEGAYNYTTDTYQTSSGTTTLYHAGARYYNPTSGRWTQLDPIDNPTNTHAWNRYDYAGDDPINQVGPSGTREDPGLGGGFQDECDEEGAEFHDEFGRVFRCEDGHWVHVGWLPGRAPRNPPERKPPRRSVCIPLFSWGIHLGCIRF